MIIKDHTCGSTIISNCFTAASAIDWMLINGFADSRTEGLQVLNDLVSNHTLSPYQQETLSTFDGIPFSIMVFLQSCNLSNRIMTVYFNLQRT